MNQLIQKYRKKVIGVLRGFDRLVLRGTLRAISYTAGLMNLLYDMDVLLKDFNSYVERTTKLLREASTEEARRLNRPVIYLASSGIRKELIAKKIMKQDGITDGLICLLSCVEPCISYAIRRDREKKKLVLERRQRKCLHLYHYWIDRDAQCRCHALSGKEVARQFCWGIGKRLQKPSEGYPGETPGWG